MNETEKLKKKLEETKKERDEFLAGWQRAKADFLNFKREDRERMQQIAGYAREELLAELFLVLDNVERAERLLKEEEKESKLVQGFLQIGKQLKDFMKAQGVQEVEAEGKEFDPRVHEAVGESDEGKSGFVTEVLEKGYRLNDRLLRPARVKVAK
ncbi:MAG: nucleotide exchange factor GrpE [bacterium]|nr:nucleotide exchange factor GrpE [bacterium]